MSLIMSAFTLYFEDKYRNSSHLCDFKNAIIYQCKTLNVNLVKKVFLTILMIPDINGTFNLILILFKLTRKKEKLIQFFSTRGRIDR